MEQYPNGFSNWLDLLSNYQQDFYEVVIVGENALQFAREINATYIPNKIVAGSTGPGDSYLLKGRYSEDNTLIYVCVNNTCKLPVSNSKSALELINTD